MTDPVKITFITPCFCRGADCSDNGLPEIRPASIRGQLHWWFRALDGRMEDEDIIFGNITKNTASASKLVVRVSMTEKRILASPTLPHKNGGHAAPKQAFAPGTSFELLLSWRRGGIGENLRGQFDRALAAWLHMGALGLRATRGGGNFTWEGQPADAEQYAESIRTLTAGTKTKIRATLLDAKTFPDAERAREVITDTLGETAFRDENRPLGGIHGRKTSPLRFRVVQFGERDFRILAVWDGQDNTEKDLLSAIQKLAAGGKEIGTLLQESALFR